MPMCVRLVLYRTRIGRGEPGVSTDHRIEVCGQASGDRSAERQEARDAKQTDQQESRDARQEGW
jgi:hypothetical protein